MSRHPFSRRSHRRKRTGVPPGARSIEECSPERWSSGRRGGWEPKSGRKEYLTFRINDVVDVAGGRLRALIDHATKHGA